MNGLSSQRQVSVQEAVHLVDKQDLVICSDSFTTLSLQQGALMTGIDDKKNNVYCLNVQEPFAESTPHVNG